MLDIEYIRKCKSDFEKHINSVYIDDVDKIWIKGWKELESHLSEELEGKENLRSQFRCVHYSGFMSAYMEFGDENVV